jgi:hypothetical protein
VCTHGTAGKRHYHLPPLTDQTNRFDAGADDVDGQRHRGAAAGDVPRRAPVPAADGSRRGGDAADAVHGAAAGGAQPAGCQPPGPPHAGGRHHGAVRALPRSQPPPANAHPSGPRPLPEFLFRHSIYPAVFVCDVWAAFRAGSGILPAGGEGRAAESSDPRANI